MTESPSEVSANTIADYAAEVAGAVGAESYAADFDTIRIYVERDRWVQVIRSARDDLGLEFLSWLSAVDWSREVAVGDPVEDVDGLEERIEVICRLSSVEDWRGAQFIATLPKDDPVIDTIVGEFAGAEWHEREAAEMFGIDFTGHPNLTHLYLPDSFEGNPLRKAFPLLAREVKPWPGTVDVEGMPGEGADAEGDGDGGDEEEAGEGGDE